MNKLYPKQLASRFSFFMDTKCALSTFLKIFQIFVIFLEGDFSEELKKKLNFSKFSVNDDEDNNSNLDVIFRW